MSEDNSTSTDQIMRLDSARAKQLSDNLAAIQSRIQAASTGSTRQPRLIAVSKLHPAQTIHHLHTEPPHHQHFGENYAQELTTKASLLPKSIKWQMLGALQTNKCKPLAETVENLWCVSSVDTAKKANELEKGRAALVAKKPEEVKEKLRVLVQVNTSGEAEKSGVEPDEAAALCRHVREKCPHLQLAGLMTIGAIARSKAAAGPDGMNEDFVTLKQVRDRVAKELGIEEAELELSMGMSADFEAAIKAGSDEVRVGTQIFGERPPKSEAKILADDENAAEVLGKK